MCANSIVYSAELPVCKSQNPAILGQNSQTTIKAEPIHLNPLKMEEIISIHRNSCSYYAYYIQICILIYVQH